MCKGPQGRYFIVSQRCTDKDNHPNDAPIEPCIPAGIHKVHRQVLYDSNESETPVACLCVHIS